MAVRALHDDPDRAGKERRRFGDERIVAGEERDRHAEFGGDAAIERRFAGVDAVHEHAREGEAADRVRKNAGRGRAGVPADEQDGLAVGIVDPGHHAEVARLAEQHLGARVELVG